MVGSPALQAQGVGLSGGLETSRNQAFAKSPSRAFLLSFFPGILLHGYGHFYAKDKLMGTTLLTGEVLSLAAIGVGLMVQDDPTQFQNTFLGNNTVRKGKDMVLYGGILFGLTWVADMAHAPTAAKEYNRRNNLEPAFSITPEGRASMTLAYRF
jgi:hypothetical protein